MIAIMSNAFFEQLRALAAPMAHHEAGERLFREGQPVTHLHLVHSGEVLLERVLPQGGRLVLQRAATDDVLAEASVFAERYHCDAVVTATAGITRVALSDLHDAATRDPALMAGFARHLAQQLQRARHQSELLALRSVSDRLDAWLSLNGGGMPAKGRWRDLAASLGVTPEALYRKIARRRGGRSKAPKDPIPLP
jgi:CRP/FNR family transcriptional regulator, dissimilatory nitrate respiration regulator